MWTFSLFVKRAAALCALCGLLCVPVTPAAAAPDAFLPAPAESVRALVRQVNRSAEVRRRYARFFGQPENRVADFLRFRVTTGRLARAGEYTLFFAHPSGVIYPVRLMLSRGVPVFQTRGGRPLLVQETGCPLVPYQTAVELVPGAVPPPIVQAGPVHQTVVPQRVQSVVVPVKTPTPVYSTPSAPASDHP